MTVEKSSFGYWKLFKYCFSWLKTPEGQKQAVFSTALILAVNLVFLGLLLTSGFNIADLREAENWTGLQIAISVLSAITGVAIILYVTARVTLEVLVKNNLSKEKLDLNKFLGYCWANVVFLAYMLFSLKDLKLLAIPIAGAVLFAAGNGSAMQTAGIVLLTAYTLVIFYNMVRLFFVNLFYLRSKTTAKRAVEDSYELTKGKARKLTATLAVVFVAMIAAFLAITAISFPLFLGIAYLGGRAGVEIILVLATILNSIKNAAMTLGVIYGTIYAYLKLEK